MTEEYSYTYDGWYDFGARWYDPKFAHWTTMDPLAEKYYAISPYAYCAGNPVNLVDPDGKEGVKYRDENKNYVVESNIVVLIDKEIVITEDMTEKQVSQANTKNQRIKENNKKYIEKVTRALNQQFGKTMDENGNTVIFKFNVKGLAVDDTRGSIKNEIIKIAVDNGIPADTPDRQPE